MEVWQDCIVIVLAHSIYDTETPVYVPMPEGTKLKTFLTADVGVKCFARYSKVREMIRQMFGMEGYYYTPIRYMLESISASLKPFIPDPYFDEQYALDYRSYLDCAGEMCKTDDEYYNKTWIFEPHSRMEPEERGGITLITPNGGGIIVEDLYREEIRRGTVITKKELMELLLERGFKQILMVDLSCNETTGTEKSISDFTPLHI